MGQGIAGELALVPSEGGGHHLTRPIAGTWKSHR